MANHAGSEGTVKVGANAVAEIRSFNVDQSGDTIEDTTMGDSARTYLAGLTNWSGSIDTYWDETDTSGQGALAVGSSITINWYPEGATSGDTYFTGTALVTSKGLASTFDGMVECSYGVQGTGALSESTV